MTSPGRYFIYQLGLVLALLTGPVLAGPAARHPAAPLSINAAPVATTQSVTVQLAADGTATLAASSVNNGSTGTAPLTYTIQKVAYGQVAENATLTLTAPTGATFSSILYASYGTSTGSSGNYTVGTCNGTNSKTVVSSYLLNNTTGSIPATNTVFTPDPCVNTLKNLAVVAAYSTSATTQTYTCAEVGTRYVLLTVTDGSGATSTATAQVTVVAAPTATLTAASPSMGTVGNTITLSGTNLSGATSITVNGTAATIASASATTLTFQVPTGATTGNIVVALPCSQSLSTPFTYNADLVVSTAGQVIQPGIYNSITVNSPGSATLGGNVTVNGSTTINSGATLSDNCYVLGGAGTFGLAAGGTLGICNAAGISASGATGAVQTTGTRSFSTDALYTYNGSVAQSTGSGLPATVRTLLLANSAGLSLTNALTTTTAATLTSGVLTTGSNALTLGSTATLSETLTAFVTGTVQTTRTLGTAGTSESFGGLGVTLTPSGAVLPGATTVRRVTGTAQSGVGTSMSVKRYFDIQPTINAGLNVALMLSVRDDERNGIAAANLHLFKSANSGSTWQGQSGATYSTATSGGLTTYSASLSGIQSLGRFTLGDVSNPLPVQLVSFTAQAQDRGVALAWRTASEHNSARFEVERSTDGLRFALLGSVPAAGTSLTARTYALTDAQLPADARLLYYRLRQVDQDGTATYSPAQSVAVVAGSLTLYPNPATHTTTLSGAAAGALVQVYDGVGTLVLTATADATGTALLALPTTLPGGLYLVRSGVAPALRLVVE